MSQIKLVVTWNDTENCQRLFAVLQQTVEKMLKIMFLFQPEFLSFKRRPYSEMTTHF